MTDDEPVRVWVDGEAVKIEGELDADCVELLDTVLGQLQEDASRPLIVDMEDVTFMDSRGMSCLIKASLRQPEQHIVLRQTTPSVLRVLQISGADHLFIFE